MNILLINTPLDGTFTFANIAITLLVALVLGIGFSFVYIFNNRRHGYSREMVITVAILPVIISIIIMLISHIWQDTSTTSTITKALSFAGVFAIVRFRSEPANPKDMIYIFCSLAVGLGCGLGYIVFTIIACIFLMIVIVLLSFVNIWGKGGQMMVLRIMIPEDLSYEEQFNELLQSYTNFYELVKVKTSEFGSLYTVTYNVKLKDRQKAKEFIDMLRTKNGNLNILLTNYELNG